MNFQFAKYFSTVFFRIEILLKKKNGLIFSQGRTVKGRIRIHFFSFNRLRTLFFLCSRFSHIDKKRCRIYWARTKECVAFFTISFWKISIILSIVRAMCGVRIIINKNHRKRKNQIVKHTSWTRFRLIIETFKEAVASSVTLDVHSNKCDEQMSVCLVWRQSSKRNRKPKITFRMRVLIMNTTISTTIHIRQSTSSTRSMRSAAFLASLNYRRKKKKKSCSKLKS